jgi:putative DNA primase/helicase
MSASFKGQNPFTFTPRFTVVFAPNFLPKVFGDDAGVWRRLRKLSFPNRLTAEDWPKAQTEAKLRADAPGILAWMVRGAVDYYANGLREPACIAAATAEYREEQDCLAGFLRDMFVADGRAFIRNTDLYRAYSDWCAEQGYEAVSKPGLYTALRDRGFRQLTRRGVDGFVGLELGANLNNDDSEGAG